MREILNEIWASIRKNKLRTFLTGFSVAWGILMLIILLGTGNGLENGLMSNFEQFRTNTITIYGGRTAEDYGGYPKGRRIRFSNTDMDILRKEFPEVQNVSPNDFYTGGQITYGKNFLNAIIFGVSHDAFNLIQIDIIDGRFFIRQDTDEKRKVIIIDELARDVLFPNESPLGKTIVSGDITFTVIGVYKTIMGGRSSSTCYIPFSTGQLIYRNGDIRVSRIMFDLPGVTTDEGMRDFENRLVARLAKEHLFSPIDGNAVYIQNNFTMYKSMSKVFGGISLFIWIIGLATLMAGIVGVSNIMLVTVRERTFEFGIRKALGAKPQSLIRLVLIEAVAITTIFGYIGLIVGVAVMEGFNQILVKNTTAGDDMMQFNMFVNPTVDISAAISATVVLIVAGMIAGYIPARKASRLKTIDALRYNQ